MDSPWSKWPPLNLSSPLPVTGSIIYAVSDSELELPIHTSAPDSYPHTTHHLAQQTYPATMCLLLATSHLCEHITITPNATPCSDYLDNYSRCRWRSQLRCPYKQFMLEDNGRLCYQCTTEFGCRPVVGSNDSGELQKCHTTAEGRRGRLKELLGRMRRGCWVKRCIYKVRN